MDNPMENPKDLYFIPILKQAYNSSDQGTDFEAALDRIVELGQEPKYALGFKNFLKFLTSGISELEENNDEYDSFRDTLIFNLISRIATGSLHVDAGLEEKVYELIETDSELKDFYNSEKKHFDLDIKPPEISFELFCTGEPKTATSETSGTRIRFERINPGHFELKTSTGLLVWEKELTKEHLLLESTLEQTLPLAADTPDLEKSHTLREFILKNTWRVSVFPGFEFGSILIEKNN